MPSPTGGESTSTKAASAAKLARPPLIRIVEIVVDHIRDAVGLQRIVGIERARAIAPAFRQLQPLAEAREAVDGKLRIDDLRVGLHHVDVAVRRLELVDRPSGS